jgi:hypothetical protein
VIGPSLFFMPFYLFECLYSLIAMCDSSSMVILACIYFDNYLIAVYINFSIRLFTWVIKRFCFALIFFFGILRENPVFILLST